MDAFGSVNFMAVALCGVISMVVGALWYGPIAGKAWLEEVGLTKEEIEARGAPIAAMVKSFIASLVLGYGLSVIIAWSGVPAGDWAGGAFVGAVTAALVIGGGVFPNYAFEDKTLRHFIIHIANIIVVMALMGAMIATLQ